MILKATFLQQREASALTIRTEKMPIKKVKMEDKRKHHHFLSLGIGDDNDEHCIYPSVYILAVTNNSHFYERKMRMCTGCQLFEKFIRRSLKSQIRVVDYSPKYYFFVYCSVFVCMFVKTFLEIQNLKSTTIGIEIKGNV